MKAPKHLTDLIAKEYWKKYSNYISPGQEEHLAILCNALAIHRKATNELQASLYCQNPTGTLKSSPALSAFNISSNVINKQWKVLKLDEKIIPDDEDDEDINLDDLLGEKK